MQRGVYSQPNQTSMALTAPPERAVTVRAPASVSTRSTRRHRRNRSEAGGSYLQPQNEFPVFSNTGDVEIIIGVGGREQRYLLHKLYLAQCSGFFETGTSDTWSKGQELMTIGEEGTSKVGTQGKMRWRYELDPGTHEDDIPMLIQKSPNDPPSSPTSKSLFGGSNNTSRGPPPSSRRPTQPPPSSFLRSMVGNFSAMNLASAHSQDDPVDDTIRDYDNLFRIFYNYSPTLDPLNIANAYVQCKSLLALADMYDALEVVGPRVDHHLLRFQSRLWKQIAKYPSSYLKLGYMSRSRAIFSEALIHVVGMWPQGATYLRSQLPPRVLDLIEDKVDDLDAAKMQAEARLFRVSLTTSRGERVSPANAYTDWQALSLFRHWLADNLSPLPGGAPPPVRKDGPASQQAPQSLPPPPFQGGQIFHTVSQAGQAYLTHDECKKFFKLRPDEFSRDGLKKFERRLDEVKNRAREIVRPLVKNCLEFDLGGRDAGGGLGYLTCTTVEEANLIGLWDD